MRGIEEAETPTLTLPASLHKGKQREVPTPRCPGSWPGLPPPLTFKEIHSCHRLLGSPWAHLLELP